MKRLSKQQLKDSLHNDSLQRTIAAQENQLAVLRAELDERKSPEKSLTIDDGYFNRYSELVAEIELLHLQKDRQSLEWRALAEGVRSKQQRGFLRVVACVQEELQRKDALVQQIEGQYQRSIDEKTGAVGELQDALSNLERARVKESREASDLLAACQNELRMKTLSLHKVEADRHLTFRS